MKRLFLAATVILAMAAFGQRQRVCIDADWMFAPGDASSPERDFGCGTEYFNYITKAASIHNEGPYSPKFDPAAYGAVWIPVDLPHDWVVDLPFDGDASHSHGYKTVGWKYPRTSVGWYRKTFDVPASDLGRHFSLQFDGIFRDARVWVNGFFLGNEPSGYADQDYDITPYLNYGGENLITVRVDATLEEGWFYEGAGIYRHVWLEKTDPLHTAYNGTAMQTQFADDGSAVISVTTRVANDSHDSAACSLRYRLIDPGGRLCAEASSPRTEIAPRCTGDLGAELTVADPALWSIDSPDLYTLVTEVYGPDMRMTDSVAVKTGLRDVAFDADRGFLLNGLPVKLKGVNLHQDHAGVGAAVPDALNLWRLRRLKDMGVNAIRSSHNPISPQILDMCDSLGIVVIDENRLTGVNDHHMRLLNRMVRRDRLHPCVILYSVGNEEWGIEWNDFGSRIVSQMRDRCRAMDPTREVTVASSSGPTVLEPADVAGYNYILQHPVDENRAKYPGRRAYGSEETSGCGTRGVYYDDRASGRMASLNRSPNGPDSMLNCIERGWKFYASRPWLGGLFWWTGFDYRGEPNPLSFPATGSEFGILDYCGFPKDEAWYLKSWWTDTPVLHILPHWNLPGHEGETVPVWVYSNCDEVELSVNGRSLGRRAMPVNGHLEWDAVYRPGTVKATGYKGGRKVMESKVATTGAPASLALSAECPGLEAPDARGRLLSVVTVEVRDAKGRVVPDASTPFSVRVDGDALILGYGNGDPAFTEPERPAPGADPRALQCRSWGGLAQLLVLAEPGAPASVTVESPDLKPATLTIDHPAR